MSTSPPDASNRSWFEIIRQQVMSNIFSMVLETLVMIVIAGYAIYEIRSVRDEVSQKIQSSHQALSSFSTQQAQKIDRLTSEVEQLSSIAAEALGVTIEEIQDNREEMIETLKTKATTKINAWVHRRSDDASENRPSDP